MSSTVKRLVLIVFRIAMILTTLRYYDNSEINDEYYATDEDVDVAIELAKVYREHAIFMYKTLPKEGDAVDDAVKRFYNNLPSEFSRKQAIEIAKKENIKTRTADAYLKKLSKSNFIEKIKNGYYTKPEKQQ